MSAKKITRIFACLLMFGAFAAAEETKTLSQWKLGEVLLGEEVDLSDQAGKVVVIEYWGAKCPRCRLILPQLAKLDKRYRDDGLVMIGAECQENPKEEIEEVVKKANIEYTITKNARGPAKFKLLPYAVVFDRSGKVVFEGDPADEKFEDAVKDSLKQPVPPLFEQQEWTNAEGKTIKAAVKKATSSDVTFVMPSGKTIDFPLEKLSEESRKKILEKVK